MVLIYLLTLHLCSSRSQMSNTGRTSFGSTKSDEALNTSSFVGVSRSYSDVKNSSQNSNRERGKFSPFHSVNQDWKNNSSGRKLYVNTNREKENETPKNTFYLNENNLKFESFLLDNHNKPKLSLEIKSNESNSSKIPLQLRSALEQSFPIKETMESRYKPDYQLVRKGNEDLSKKLKDNDADLVVDYVEKVKPSPEPALTIPSEKEMSYTTRMETKAPLNAEIIFPNLVASQNEETEILKSGKNYSNEDTNRQARQLGNSNESISSVSYFINSSPPLFNTKVHKDSGRYDDKISDPNSSKRLYVSENDDQTQILPKVSQDVGANFGYSENDQHKLYPVCATSPTESTTATSITKHISHHVGKLHTYSQTVPQRTYTDESLSTDFIENKRKFAPINFEEGSNKAVVVPEDFSISNKLKHSLSNLYQVPNSDFIFPNKFETNYLTLLSSLTGLNPMPNVQSITPAIYSPHGQGYHRTPELQNFNPFSNFITGKKIFPQADLNYLSSSPFSMNYDFKDGLQNNNNQFYFATKYPSFSQSSNSGTLSSGLEQDSLQNEGSLNNNNKTS